MAKASQVVIMEGEYYIIKSPNGKVLEVKDFNTENGAGIQLWSYAGHPWQQWQFVDAGEGRWRIQNRFTGKMPAGERRQRPWLSGGFGVHLDRRRPPRGLQPPACG